MENINLLDPSFVDHKHQGSLFKNEILWNLLETKLSVEQSDKLVDLIISGVGSSSCMCCISEEAKYIIKKTARKEMKLNPSQNAIQKFIEHCSKKVQFDCEEVQNFIRKISA